MRCTPIFTLLLIIVCFATACSHKKCTPATKTYTWSTSKYINVIDTVISHDGDSVRYLNYFIKDSNHTVVNFADIPEYCPDVSDGPGSTTFAFQLDNDLKDFQLVDSQLYYAKCFLKANGSRSATPVSLVTKGKISGTKTDENTWQISVNVITTPGEDGGKPVNLSFTKNFTKN